MQRSPLRNKNKFKASRILKHNTFLFPWLTLEKEKNKKKESINIARMHSRKKGISGSTRPAVLKTPDWCPLSAEETEAEVIRLAKRGESMARIGLILRDQYGIPLVKTVTGKKISQILEENDLQTQLPEDLTFLARKALKIRRHLEDNKKDKFSRQGLLRTESKIYRLIKYYKKKGRLPADFKYRPDKIQIMLR